MTDIGDSNTLLECEITLMRISGIIAFLLFCLLVAGCSSDHKNPVEPSEIPSGHSLLGIWTANLDVDTNDLKLESFRGSNIHWNVTQWLNAPTIDVRSYDPASGILEVDVTITNSTIYDAYDIRFIVFTDNLGNRLKNPDEWTPLYDIPGGAEINPFRSYAKNETLRLFSGSSQHTERLQLYFPAGNKSVKFAIDASYPANCEEPYSIRDFKQGKLLEDAGSSTHVEVKVHDWQNDVNSVQLYCPSITGDAFIPFTRAGTTLWELELTNNSGTPEGDYLAVVKASAVNSGSVSLYDIFKITISSVTGWANSWGGASGDIAKAVVCDNFGNFYVTGFFRGTVDFDPSAGEDFHTSLGYADAYLSKFNALGEWTWTKTWGGSYRDELGLSVALDSFGDVYVTGSFYYKVDFDPGPGIEERTVKGVHDVFLSKFDPDGNFIRVRTWGGFIYDTGNCVSVDNFDNVFVCGSFSSAVDFDPGVSVDERISKGYLDIFISRFNSAGDYIGVKTVGGVEDDSAMGISVDSTGNQYVTGGFRQTVDFDPGIFIYERSSLGNNDIFLLCLDSMDNFNWVQTWGGIDTDYGYSVDTDSFGNVFVTGYFVDVVDFDPSGGVDEWTSHGGNDIFLSKFQTSGNFLWAKAWGDINWSEEGWCVKTDSFGDIYVSGRFCYTPVDFDPGPGVDIHYSKGWDEIFLTKFDTGGNHIWARTFGGGWIEEYGDFGYGIAIDPDQNVAVTGTFKLTCDFDPDETIYELTSNGAEDSYITRFTSRGDWHD
ncbi:MAG: hypothetical protein ABIG42_00305 [bacterium]